MGAILKTLKYLALGTTLAVINAVFPITIITTAHAETNNPDAVFSADRTGSQVELTWNLSEEGANFTLLRNGIEIYEDSGDGSFHEVVSENQEVTYQLDLSRIEDPANAIERVSTLSLRVPIGSQLGLESSNASAGATSTLIRYQTFIPSAYVHQPAFVVGACIAAPEKYFGGDNRGFNPNSNNFRTRLDANVNWLSSSITSYREVGTTLLYNKVGSSYVLQDSKTASAGSLNVTPISITSSRAEFRMEGDVGNPFCFGALGISFNVKIVVYRAGMFAVYGTRKAVPNHEMFFKDSNSTWFTVMTKPMASFDCLNPFYYPFNTSQCEQVVDVVGNNHG